MDEPRPIGDDVEQILSEVLPPEVADFRAIILQKHAEDVLALRESVRQAYLRRLKEVADYFVGRGFRKEATEKIAVMKLAGERLMMNAELEERLDKIRCRTEQKIFNLTQWAKTRDQTASSGGSPSHEVSPG